MAIPAPKVFLSIREWANRFDSPLDNFLSDEFVSRLPATFRAEDFCTRPASSPFLPSPRRRGDGTPALREAACRVFIQQEAEIDVGLLTGKDEAHPSWLLPENRALLKHYVDSVRVLPGIASANAARVFVAGQVVYELVRHVVFCLFHLCLWVSSSNL